MPTLNQWLNLSNDDDGHFFDWTAGWQLGHVPTSTEQGVINATDPSYAPTDCDGPVTTGSIDFVNGQGADYALSQVHCLGGIALVNIDDFTIGRVDGPVTGSAGGFQCANFNGTVAASIVTDIFNITGGTGTITVDIDLAGGGYDFTFDGFNGTLINTVGGALDLDGTALGTNATLLPNRAAFTNYSGGRPDNNPLASMPAIITAAVL